MNTPACESAPCCPWRAKAQRCLSSLALLLLRVGFGYQFMLAGWGKLSNIDKPAAFFHQLGIPFPKLNAYLAGSTECFGGALLLLGLASRVVSVPLAFTMLVAYSTAHRQSIVDIFSPTPDAAGHIDGLAERLRFAFDQPPFPFLCAALIVLALGPGKVSLDHLLRRRCGKSSCHSTPTPPAVPS